MAIFYFISFHFILDAFHISFHFIFIFTFLFILPENKSRLFIPAFTCLCCIINLDLSDSRIGIWRATLVSRLVIWIIQHTEFSFKRKTDLCWLIIHLRLGSILCSLTVPGQFALMVHKLVILKRMATNLSWYISVAIQCNRHLSWRVLIRFRLDRRIITIFLPETTNILINLSAIFFTQVSANVVLSLTDNVHPQKSSNRTLQLHTLITTL